MSEVSQDQNHSRNIKVMLKPVRSKSGANRLSPVSLKPADLML